MLNDDKKSTLLAALGCHFIMRIVREKFNHSLSPNKADEFIGICFDIVRKHQERDWVRVLGMQFLFDLISILYVSNGKRVNTFS